MIKNIPVFNLVLFTAVTGFMLGIYVQHEDALEGIQNLVQSDPYAYFIRQKIYALLRIFKVQLEDQVQRPASTRMQEIMKYGFPGMDDVRLYEDFVLSYDRRNRVAHWVYEHLKPTSLRQNSNVSRQTAIYQPDMNVPSNFRAVLQDYQRSGYDRGHLAAAGNHHGHQTHCNETFFLTNIAPQVGRGFNRDAWNKLENYVRELTERYGSVYVCTGPLYKPKQQPNGKWAVDYEVIGSNMVAVPTHFFKVIIVESKLPKGSPYMEAYVMPNTPISNSVDLRSFLCDIREIEHIAGLQFFDGLRRSYFFGTNYNRASQIFREFI